eukprot:Amastigsp_a343746_44.p3 type:complete len:115 gc:universal Amastigsp_a343746_44:779-435(-)
MVTEAKAVKTPRIAGTANSFGLLKTMVRRRPHNGPSSAEQIERSVDDMALHWTDENPCLRKKISIESKIDTPIVTTVKMRSAHLRLLVRGGQNVVIVVVHTETQSVTRRPTTVP